MSQRLTRKYNYTKASEFLCICLYRVLLETSLPKPEPEPEPEPEPKLPAEGAHAFDEYDLGPRAARPHVDQHWVRVLSKRRVNNGGDALRTQPCSFALRL